MHLKNLSLPRRWQIYWYILLEELSLVLRTSYECEFIMRYFCVRQAERPLSDLIRL